MAKYIEAMIITVLMHVYNVLSWVFEKPKTRVRKTNGIRQVFGTVEKTMRAPIGNPGVDDHDIDYWTVVWDDEPGIWQTLACHRFQWIDGQFTLVDFKM